MTEKQTFTDEQLVAYLDGEVEFTPAAEITAALAHDPELANRLAALDFDSDALKSGFDALLIEKRAPELPKTIGGGGIAAGGGRNWVMAGSIAASILAALFVGYGAGNLLNQPEAPGWKAYVASYQSLYSADTLRHVETSADAQTIELERATAAIGKSIDLAALQRHCQVVWVRTDFGSGAAIQAVSSVA